MTRYRELADGVGAEMDVRLPDGYQAALSSPTTNRYLVLWVFSPCVRPADGRYPG